MSVTVVFITGRGHSGSTLLDLLLSAHSETVSVGEARFSPGMETSTCACSKPVVECPFWAKVDVKLRDRQLSLATLDLWATDPKEFTRHNAAFYQVVAELTGKRVIVDSSKNHDRMQSLMTVPGLDVKPIHLVREPHGVVFSYSRKGKGSWLKQTVLYTKRVIETRWMLRDHEHRVVRYEDLVANPAGTVGQLMAWVGLVFEPGQLSWVGKERHDCGGNRMRFSKDTTIRVDEAWSSGLTTFQKLAISALTLPARP